MAGEGPSTLAASVLGGQGLSHPSLDREGGRASLEIPVKCRNGSELQLLSGVYSNAPAVVAPCWGFFI